MVHRRLPTAFPVLRGEGITLREPDASDVDSWFALQSDPEAIAQTSDILASDRREIAVAIARMRDSFVAQERIRWAIVPDGEAASIGSIGFNLLDEYHGRGELGYSIRREWWGQGIGTEAARLVVAYGFEMLALQRIEATVMVGNERSLGVLGKLGFEREGVLRDYKNVRGEMRDFWIWSLLRRDWGGT